ncbi:hypothetical protein [Bacillus cereus]|nr:hypothetical protein [Bacillus cereus]
MERPNSLINTIVVDISEMILSEKYKDTDTRQLVKHSRYKKVRICKNHAS